MMGEIDVKEWKIKELDYELATQFVVPRIQRTYTWDKNEVEDFINDLKKISNEDYLEHYFGAFCTAEKPEKTDNVELIIDGQQRIATSHLFLKCAQKKIHDVYLKKHVDNIINNSKIVLGKNDQKVFEKIMKDEEIDVEEKQSKLSKTYQIFDNFLRNKNDVDKLVETLLSRFKLVKIRLPYKKFKRTFHLVNNRGKVLAQDELIKSHIFMDLETDKEITTTELDKLDGQWNDMSKKIYSQFRNDKSINEFIQHVLSVKHGTTQFQSTYYKLLESKDLNTSSKPWLLELFEWSNWYMDLLKQPEKFAEPSVSGRLNVTTWLNRIKILKAKNIYPILLAGYNKYFMEKNKKDFYKLVDSCYRFHFRVKTLGDMNVTPYTNFTQTIANKMYDDGLKLDEVIQKLNCEIKKWVEEKNIKSIYDSTANISATQARHCLLLIEEYEYGVEKVANNPTVEHVLPKNHKGQHWSPYIKENYLDEDEPEQYIKNLGNMVLLSDKKNSGIQDKPLSEKIQKYRKSAYKITQELQEQKDWKVGDIEGRHRRYVKSLEMALDITAYPPCTRNK